VTDPERPLVTFVLYAYNQEACISKAVASAFSQTYSPLEIILSDDCSSDRTFELMQTAAAEYKGPHTVVLNRNERNFGIGDHVNAVARLISGSFVVMAGGDDVSVPDRSHRLVRRWLDLGRPTVVMYSDFSPVNIDALPVELLDESIYRGPHSLEDMARGQLRVLGATEAVTRDVFNSFPPFRSAVVHEDRVLPFRALLLGGHIELVDEKLVRYRVDGGLSRMRIETAREFLHEYVPKVSVRTLPDAIQRLDDLNHAKPDDVLLRKLCSATIATHEAFLALAKAKWFQLEARLFEFLLRGARPGTLIGLYLKLRFFWLYDLFFRPKSRRKQVL
jgi:glycosyltransferase involved in cell wall biosynthesis